MKGSLIPLSRFGAEYLPEDWLSPLDGALDGIAVDPDSGFGAWTETGIAFGYQFFVLRKVAFELPLLAGTELRLGAAESFPDFALAVSTEPEFSVAIGSIDLTLHLPPTIANTAPRDGAAAGEADGEEGDAAERTGYDLIFETDISVAAGPRFDFVAPHIVDMQPFEIAHTSFIVDLGASPDVRLILGDAPGEIAAELPTGFSGLWLGAASARYAKGESTLTFSLTNAAIGSGGFTGDLSFGDVDAADSALSAAEERGEGAEETLEGMRAVIRYASVSFSESVPTGGGLSGYVFLPFVERWFQVSATIAGPEGAFLLELGGASGEALFEIESDWLEIEADSISFFEKDGDYYAAVSGSVRPTLGDFDWPSFEVEKLAVSADGDVDFEGGWIDLPEKKTLDFHGFKIDIEKIGVGRADAEIDTETGEETPRSRWLGFSGGVSLIDGLPLTGSVQGLTFTWTGAARRPKTRLDGVAISMEIPNTLALSGSVAFQDFDEDVEGVGDAEPRALSGKMFIGHVRVDLISLNTTVEGDIVIGRLREADGSRTPVLYIRLKADFPKAIPLGASGAGLYGLEALFGMNVAPDRRMTAPTETIEAGPEDWYAWYAREEPSFNVTNFSKWRVQPDEYAFGGGLIVGTQYDDGYSLNIHALVAVLIPGPVVIIEGKGDLFKKREGAESQATDVASSAVDDQAAEKKREGAFYALAVIDARENIFQINLELKYVLGKILEVGGGLEAFFDFDDPKLWRIWLGQKEPTEKRIAAKVIGIITADTYLMLSHGAILYGSAVGIDWKRKYGPVRLTLDAGFGFDAGVHWRPTVFEGAVFIDGGFGLKVFGIGFELFLGLDMDGIASQPWWIHGVAEVRLGTPWPLPTVQAEIDFSWGRTDGKDWRAPLQSAALYHHKFSDLTWDLFEAQSDADYTELMARAPITPVDVTPLLSFDRPLSNPNLRLNAPAGFVVATDEIGGEQAKYYVGDVKLYKRTAAGRAGNPVRESGEGRDLAESFMLDYLSVTPQPGTGDDQQMKLRLWRYGHYEGASRDYREGANAAAAPCAARNPEKMTCVDWRQAPEGMSLEEATRYKQLTFIASPSRHALVEGRARRWPEPALWEGAYTLDDVTAVTIRFPRPVARARLRLSPNCTPYLELEGLYRGERVFHVRFADVTARNLEAELARGGAELPLRDLFAGAEGSPAEIDALKISPSRSTYRPLNVSHDLPAAQLGVSLEQICYLETEAFRRNLEGESVDGAPSSPWPTTASSLFLEPDTLYELSCESGYSLASAEEDGSESAWEGRPLIAAAPRSFFFRTGKAPGSAYEDAPDYAGGPVDTLGAYVEASTPGDGAELAYRSYDIALEFNEPYGPDLYPEGLVFSIIDANGAVVARGALTASDGGRPLLGAGLVSLMAARESGGCSVEEDAPIAPRLVGAMETPLAARKRFTCRIARSDGVCAPLHEFIFATSAYSSLEALLRSGLTDAPPTLDDILASTEIEERRRISAGEGAANLLERPRRRDGGGGGVVDVGEIVDRLRSEREAEPPTPPRPAPARPPQLTQIVRVLRNARPPDVTAWSREWRRDRDAYVAAVDALAGAATVTDRVFALDAVGKAESALRRADIEVFETLDASLDDAFAARDLAHRPRPPRLELIWAPVSDGGLLMLDSPEPIDWRALKISHRRRLSGPLPRFSAWRELASIWSRDGARAFLFRRDIRLLAPGAQELSIAYRSGGADRPDLSLQTIGARAVEGAVALPIALPEV